MPSVQCPHCGAKLNVPEAALGKNGRCPKCQEKFLVQVPAPLDELDPLGASSGPLGDFDPLAQPLPPLGAPAMGPAMALASQGAARPVAKGQPKQKAASAGLGNKQKITLLVGGGILLALALVSFVVIGVVAFVMMRSGDFAGAGKFHGKYAVVDSLPNPPAEPAEERPPPLDTEDAAAKANSEWAVKPDPPAGSEKAAGSVVGALSPEPSLLLASLGGPYAVGVAPEPERGRREKVLKQPDGSPGEVIAIDKEPHAVLDIRTGKPVGRFPAEARIRFNCRLSPDGRYLASSVFETQGTAKRVVKDELVVWQRDADQPACRWRLPGPVLWADFIGPDRPALYHVAGPQFVVLDVTKGAPVVTAPLPGEEFTSKFDPFSKAKAYTSYRVWTSGGAVSPGRKWIALGGSKNIVLIDTAGRMAGRLKIDQVNTAKHYMAISFNGAGDQLRALTERGEAPALLNVWSLADGQSLHNKTYPFKLRDGENPYRENAPGLAILDGPQPNTLIVSHQLIDLGSGQVAAELPYQPQRLAGPKQLLALGRLDQAANTKELSETADFVPRGSSLIVAGFDGEALLANAPKPPPAVATKPERPAPATADRSKVTAVQLKPPATWGLKPGAESPRPTGPLPQWPHAFAATEGAVLTDSPLWIRYDLNTGATIGEPIDLWPGQPQPTEPLGGTPVALSRDGKRLALVDAADRARVDVWDTTGKRLIGLRPYKDERVLWLGWSADGKLLTADGARLSGWDVSTGQAAFEVLGNFARLVTAPDAKWVMAKTPARHLFFLDAETGQNRGHIPANPAYIEQALSPDGKTLLRAGQGLEVWDLETGKRKSDLEIPLVPVSSTAAGPLQAGVLYPQTGIIWLSPRRFLSHTKRPGEERLGYYLYDFDAHTHTYRYDASLGTFKNDSLGRPWMQTGSDNWVATHVPGDTFDKKLAFGPGTTVRVEVDVGSRENSRKTAEKMAESLHWRGFKIGRDGWVLRADHTTSSGMTDDRDLQGQKVFVATVNITWRLLDPAGKEAWTGTSGGKFNPFQSKYVVVGSRRTDMMPGGPGAGGSTQVRLDYKGQDPMSAQVDEILEKDWSPPSANVLREDRSGVRCFAAGRIARR